MIRTAPAPQSLYVGIFLVLLAAVCAVAPMPVLLRSLGVMVCAYLAFAVGGMPWAYLAALLAPPVGLLSGDTEWLVMLPIVLSGNLLATVGLEFGWRWPALALSPVLLALPSLVTLLLSERELFRVDLPWGPSGTVWVLLHLLIGAAGVLGAILIERRRLHAEPA